MISYFILSMLSAWMEASKLGLNGWEFLIPIYDLLKKAELVGFKKKTLVILLILCCVPIINFIFSFILSIYLLVLGSKYAKLIRANYGGNFWGHFLLPFIYSKVYILKNAPNETDAASQLINRLVNAHKNPLFKNSDLSENYEIDIDTLPEL